MSLPAYNPTILAINNAIAAGGQGYLQGKQQAIDNAVKAAEVKAQIANAQAMSNYRWGNLNERAGYHQQEIGDYQAAHGIGPADGSSGSFPWDATPDTTTAPPTDTTTPPPPDAPSSPPPVVTSSVAPPPGLVMATGGVAPNAPVAPTATAPPAGLEAATTPPVLTPRPVPPGMKNVPSFALGNFMPPHASAPSPATAPTSTPPVIGAGTPPPASLQWYTGKAPVDETTGLPVGQAPGGSKMLDGLYQQFSDNKDTIAQHIAERNRIASWAQKNNINPASPQGQQVTKRLQFLDAADDRINTNNTQIGSTIGNLLGKNAESLKILNAQADKVASGNYDPMSFERDVRDYVAGTGMPYNGQVTGHDFGLKPKDYGALITAVNSGKTTFHGKPITDITGGALPYKMADGSVGFVDPKTGTLLDKPYIPLSDEGQQRLARQAAQTDLAKTRDWFIRTIQSPDVEARTKYTGALTQLTGIKITDMPSLDAAMIKFRDAQSGILGIRAQYEADLLKSEIDRNETGAAHTQSLTSGDTIANKFLAQRDAIMKSLNTEKGGLAARKDILGTYTSPSFLVIDPKNPRNLIVNPALKSPGDIAQAQTTLQNALPQWQQRWSLEHQANQARNAQSSATTPSSSSRPASGSPAAAGPVPPIVNYIKQRSGQRCTGVDCGTGLEKLLGMPLGQGGIQGLRDNDPVQPDANGNVPDGTGVWFGGSTAANRHYGVKYTDVNGVARLAEIHNSGPHSGYQYDDKRALADVRNESTHRGYAVKYFAIPHRGINGQGQMSHDGGRVVNSSAKSAMKAALGL